MSLSSNLSALATRIATESKAIRTLVNGNAADNSALSTTAKGNLVAAINEVYAAVATAAGIDDSTVSTSKTWSSSKTNSTINSVSAAAAAAIVNDGAPAAGTTWSSNKINSELASRLAALIDDVSAVSTTKVWSSSKSKTYIDAAVAAVVDASPGALDTLKELATALGNDPNFATTITTALGNRVRFDAAQTLNGTQKTQAQQNINVPDATAVGDLTTDFVAAFNAGLV